MIRQNSASNMKIDFAPVISALGAPTGFINFARATEQGMLIERSWEDPEEPLDFRVVMHTSGETTFHHMPPHEKIYMHYAPTIYQDNNEDCAVCMSEPKDTVFLPCKHFYCCSRCAVRMSACPYCRKLIQHKIKRGCLITGCIKNITWKNATKTWADVHKAFDEP